MTKLTAACETCGKTMEFFPSQVRRYCSQRCMGAARSGRPRPLRPPSPVNKVTSVCPVCGAEFEHWPGQKRTTCSRACLYKYLPAHRRATKSTTPSSKVTATCAVCGQQFTHFPSQRRVTCSTTCGGLYRGRQRKGHKRGPMPAARTGQVLACATCGAEFYATKAQIAHGRRFCSPACRSLADRVERTIVPCAYCSKDMALKPSAVANGRRFCSRQCQSLGSVRSWTLLERTYNGRPVKQDRKGYIWVWAPERANRAHPSFGGWYPEHRIVVEEALGHDLDAEAHVHHVNGIKDDNRIENLQVMAHGEHARLSLMDHTAFMARVLVEWKEYRRLYGPLLPAADDEATSSGGSTSSAAAR